MELFVEITTYILILYTMFLYIRRKIFIVQLLKKKKNINNIKKDNIQIIITIPVLKEQKCICDTVKYFREISGDLPIILITTQKEIKENFKNEKTTQDIIKEQILSRYKNVYCINYPYMKGYMADQLNYMLENVEKILDRKIDFENTFLALYNADSKPNKKTFEEIIENINKGEKVMQQYSYCMKNYNDLSNLLKGFSIYQSNFEINIGLMNTYFKNNLLYTYVVGHGLIINMKILKELDGFNTKFWCEDVYLGLQLKFNGIKITPLLVLENIETPNTFKKIIKQNSVWFKTTSQFYEIYKNIKEKQQIKYKYRGLIGIINEFRCAINWIGFPIFLLVITMTILIIKEYKLLIFFILSYLLYITVNTTNTIKIINILENKKYKLNIKIILNVLIATSISNIGPIYSILFNKKEKYKTER